MVSTICTVLGKIPAAAAFQNTGCSPLSKAKTAYIRPPIRTTRAKQNSADSGKGHTRVAESDAKQHDADPNQWNRRGKGEHKADAGGK